MSNHGGRSRENDRKTAISQRFNAIQSLSEELDDMFEMLDQHDQRSTITPHFDVGCSVDVSSLEEVASGRKSTNRRSSKKKATPRKEGTINDGRGCPSPHQSPMRNIGTKTGRASAPKIRHEHKVADSVSSIASMEKQTKYLNTLLKRTTEDKSYTGPRLNKGNASTENSFTTPHQNNKDKGSLNSVHQYPHRQESLNATNGISPPQLQSPSFHFYSPTSTAPSSKLDGTGLQSETIGRSNLCGETENNGHAPPTSTRDSECYPALDNVKQIMQAKDERIRYLEDENLFLRKLLSEAQSKEREPETPPRRDSEVQSKESQQEAPQRRDSEVQSTERDQKIPQRGESRNTKYIPEAVTPGTKFVAELSSLTNVEVGNHAPLSFLIDKHWDRLMSYTEEQE